MEFKASSKITYKDGYLIIPLKYQFGSQLHSVEKLMAEQETAKYPYKIKVEQDRPARSLNANNYAWQIMTEIAETLSKEYPKSKEEVYIDMLTRYGQREHELYKMTEEAYRAFQRATENHCCIVDSMWNGEKQYYSVAILIGSSDYDTKQMSLLIDGIVSEAKDLGIETLTPDELARLKQEWKK